MSGGLSPAGARLRKIVRGRVLEHEPLCHYTSFGIGGPADILLQPQDREDIAAALDFAVATGLPVTTLGAGTNVLVADAGIRGLVLHLCRTPAGIERTDSGYRVGGGELLSHLATMAARDGLEGIEFLAGIPGTVGGAVMVNAGAYGRSVFDCVSGVEAIDRVGRPVHIGRDQMSAGYRWSSLDGKGLVVTGVWLKLRPGDREELLQAIAQTVEARNRKHPLCYPSAGSFFKNPELAPAGRLIEQAELKGFRCGGAAVSDAHANFIVNEGGATADDVLRLARVIRERVRKRFEVGLEFEVRLLGFTESAAT